MENTRDEEFTLLVLLVLFWSSSISSSEKSDPGKPAASQKAVVFSLVRALPPRHPLFRLPITPMNVRFHPEIDLCLPYIWQ